MASKVITTVIFCVLASCSAKSVSSPVCEKDAEEGGCDCIFPSEYALCSSWSDCTRFARPEVLFKHVACSDSSTGINAHCLMCKEMADINVTIPLGGFSKDQLEKMAQEKSNFSFAVSLAPFMLIGMALGAAFSFVREKLFRSPPKAQPLLG
mmetsp:Transcript_27834/g.48429  ORF Transcript_27834/g.48429 Transcript_27834/m.48429 type:complete len:152 (+) Transcript_27834:236-691(+)